MRRVAASAAGFALCTLALAALVFSGSAPSRGDALLEGEHQAGLATASTIAAVHCDANGCAPAARRTRNECTIFGCTTVTVAPVHPKLEASRARLQSKQSKLYQTDTNREEGVRRNAGERRSERERPHERDREHEGERLQREQRSVRSSGHERGEDLAGEVQQLQREQRPARSSGHEHGEDAAAEVQQLQAQLHEAHSALKGTTEALQMESKKMKGLMAKLGGRDHEIREDKRAMRDDRADTGEETRELRSEEAQHRAEVRAMASARKFVTSAGARMRGDDALARREDSTIEAQRAMILKLETAAEGATAEVPTPPPL